MTKDQIQYNKKGFPVFKNKSGQWERAYQVKCSWCGVDCFCRYQSLSYDKQFCTLECQRKNVGFRLTGEKHHNWKGGNRKRASGYTIIMSPDHPNKNRDGYMFEHRLIMEKKIGRYLTSNEKVHHINGDKTDNNIDNLYITESFSHKKIHSQLEKIAYSLVKTGLIKFKDGEYFL